MIIAWPVSLPLMCVTFHCSGYALADDLYILTRPSVFFTKTKYGLPVKVVNGILGSFVFFFSVLCFSCFRVCSLLSCGRLRGKD